MATQDRHREDGEEERRFHFSGDGSHKFWAVSVHGAEQRVRFGRIGTAGQERTKTFADAEAARAATDRLVAEKLEKGYRPVTAAEARCARPVPVARRRAAVPPARQLSLPFADPADAPAPDKNPVSAAEPTAAAPLSLALDF